MRRLAKRIIEAGFSVWLDEHELRPGDRLSEEIASAVSRAKVVLVVVSVASIRSRWLGYELNLAAERMIKGDCRVIPILISQCAVPSSIDGLLYADFRSSFARGAKSVLNALLHEANRAIAAGGFRAQARDLVQQVFEWHGWVSRYGDFDHRNHDVVSFDDPRRDGRLISVVLDLVAILPHQNTTIGEQWWTEYTHLRGVFDEVFFLVVTERAVALPADAVYSPGGCVKHKRFPKSTAGHEVGHVIFADLSTASGQRGRLAIVRRAKAVLATLAR